MKRVTNYLFMFFMSATVLFVTSCGDDGEDIIPFGDGATIEFQTNATDSVEFSDTTAAPGSTLVFYLAIDFGEDEVTGVNVTDDLGTTILTTTLSGVPSAPTQVTYEIPADAPEDVTVTANLVDADGASLADASFTVTVEAAVPAQIYTAFLLAAPTDNSNSDSFYSTATGTLYSFNDIIATSANLSETVDFGYAYGQSEGATINAPSAYPNYVGYDMSQWNTLNETVFRTPSSIDVADFEAITPDQGNRIISAFEVGASPDTDRVLNLTPDTLIAFRTSDERYGLIRVREVVGTIGSNDGIRIEVKVTGAEDEEDNG